MFAIRLFISLSAAVILVGCGGTRPDPLETTSSAGSHEPDLVGIATAKPRETPESLQEKQTKLEAQLKLLQEFAGRGELDRAIQLLEEAVTVDARHRTVLLLLTQYLQTRSKTLATVDPGRAYGLMVQSGGYLRALRGTHDDFSAAEREIIANVLFDEACAHARSNRQEETSGGGVARATPSERVPRVKVRRLTCLQYVGLVVELSARVSAGGSSNWLWITGNRRGSWSRSISSAAISQTFMFFCVVPDSARLCSIQGFPTDPVDVWQIKKLLPRRTK